jgi:tRNA pseudouridine55 synthase
MRGVLNVNKPSGITSYDVIRRLKPVLDTRQLGHAGTLDPLATGVLLVLVNEATKVADYLQMLDKEYLAEIRLGIRTDTDDITGRILEEKSANDIKPEAVAAVLTRFRGEIEQAPPAFSAVKVAGDRSYRLARKGEAPEHKPRRVLVHELELVELRTADCGSRGPILKLRARVSRGTYIRALARDIGAELGCGATLHSLVRTRVGAFTVQDAVGLDAPDIVQHLIAIDQALAFLADVTVTADAVPRLRAGRRLDENDVVQGWAPQSAAPVVVRDADRRMLFIGEYRDQGLQPKRGIYADA